MKMITKIDGKIDQKYTERSCNKKDIGILHRTNNCAHKDNIFISNLTVLCIQNGKISKTRFTVKLKNVL